MSNNVARRFDPFPSDGEWARSPWFLEVAPEHACPEAISEAVAALRPVFPPELVHELTGIGHFPHPFAWHYYQRGGIRSVLTLGRCLSLIGSPPEIVSDLANHARYKSRFAEAWAGALFVRLGSQIQYIPEIVEGKKPEFIASFPEGGRLSVEVKGLEEGLTEKWIVRVTLAFQEGIWEAQRTANMTAHPPSHADVTPPLERLAEIALGQDEAELEEARALGREVGRQWIEFLDQQPTIGQHEVSPHLSVHVLPEEERPSSGQSMMRTPELPERYFFDRLPRNVLNPTARKFEQHGHPGVLILEKPPMRSWSEDDLAMLEHELNRPAAWARQVAAVLIKYDLYFDFDDRYHDMVRLMQGPMAHALPPCFAEVFPVCTRCGYRHAEVDFLRST